ncbi:uncharacterized protein LOC110927576 [Helianthus annuus]|uniref:uncharacterized protein LOC110927576 n=1 Tax=Helianthus annuus TaxID=4232 RepID=UPI000B8EF676|nr:uncharacterized protein LOC110927576 [Helianthus annuus]
MREVEYQEKVAEKATKEAALSSLDTLVKMDKRNQALVQAKETKNMLVTKVNAEKNVLAVKMELIHRRVANMLDVGDRSLDALSEMDKALKQRLTSAISRKELANWKKQKNESTLANYQEHEIEKVVEEFNRLNQETLENSKVQELLKDLEHLTDTLNGEITDQRQDVNQLKV